MSSERWWRREVRRWTYVMTTMTVIDWINDYASDPKNFVIIIKKYKDECLNEFIKYLQEIM